MSHASFVAGDTASILRVTCKDTSGVVIDLTASTVTLFWKTSRGALVSRVMTIVAPATDGKAQYQFGAGELEARMMRFETAIVDSSGKELTSLDPLYEFVRKPFDQAC